MLHSDELVAIADAMLDDLDPESTQILLKLIEAMEFSSPDTPRTLVRVLEVLDFNDVNSRYVGPSLTNQVVLRPIRLKVAAERLTSLRRCFVVLSTLDHLCKDMLPSKYTQIQEWITCQLSRSCQNVAQDRSHVDAEMLAEVALSRENESLMTA